MAAAEEPPGRCPFLPGRRSSSSSNSNNSSSKNTSTAKPGKDLSKLREDIARRLVDPNHDDGSLAPLMIRHAWHNCGTFDASTRTGGSNGSTLRFPAESQDPENAGFDKAKGLLETLHAKYPHMTFADLSILTGNVAIEAAGGPFIPFGVGRKDFTAEEATVIHGAGKCPFGDGQFNPSGSRLPAADLGPDPACPAKATVAEREHRTISAVRGTFERMGFDDKETVCLILLGHQFGRCHSEVSGNEEAWYAFDPAHWNMYESGLGYLTAVTMAREGGRFREVTTKAGKRQFNMNLGGLVFMMLVSDMCLVWDDTYFSHVRFYDRNRRDFRRDSAEAWKKLTELGCDGLLTPEITPRLPEPSRGGVR